MTENIAPSNTSLPAANLIEKAFDSLIASPETPPGMPASSYMAMIANSNLVTDTPNATTASDSAVATGD